MGDVELTRRKYLHPNATSPTHTTNANVISTTFTTGPHNTRKNTERTINNTLDHIMHTQNKDKREYTLEYKNGRRKFTGLKLRKSPPRNGIRRER